MGKEIIYNPLDNNKPLFIEMHFPVNTYDIDIAGHVNNIVYIRWLEDLRNNLFSQILPLEKLLKADYYPVVISSDVKYKKQIKLFDKPSGIMFLENHLHGIYTLKAEILLNNHIVFTSTQKCILMDLIHYKMFKGTIHDIELTLNKGSVL